MCVFLSANEVLLASEAAVWDLHCMTKHHNGKTSIVPFLRNSFTGAASPSSDLQWMYSQPDYEWLGKRRRSRQVKAFTALQTHCGSTPTCRRGACYGILR